MFVSHWNGWWSGRRNEPGGRWETHCRDACRVMRNVTDLSLALGKSCTDGMQRVAGWLRLVYLTKIILVQSTLRAFIVGSPIAILLPSAYTDCSATLQNGMAFISLLQSPFIPKWMAAPSLPVAIKLCQKRTAGYEWPSTRTARIAHPNPPPPLSSYVEGSPVSVK